MENGLLSHILQHKDSMQKKTSTKQSTIENIRCKIANHNIQSVLGILGMRDS